MSGISSQSFSAPTPPIAGQEVGLQDQVGESPDLADQSDQISISNLTNIVNNISTTVTGSYNADLVAKLALWDPVVNPCISIAGRGTAGDKGGGTFHGVLVAGGPAVDNAMVFGTANPLWRGIRDYTDHLCPNWFGTEGDGTTNDTAALQAALDATITWGVPLRCDNLATYLVRYAGATFNGYALKFKHGTRCDLNGATIKLDNDQWCSVIINEHISVPGSPDHVELYNGIIDGNEAGQTRVWSAGAWKRAVGGTLLTYTPTVCMLNLTAPVFEDLTINNAYICAHYIQNATRPYVHGLTINGAWGDGSFLALCTDSDIDDIYAADCRHVGEHPAWGSSWGQGIVWNLQHAAVGTVTLKNCQTPGKVQDNTSDAVWDKLLCVAGVLTCLPSTATPPDRGVHWGIKFQGTDAAGHHCERIKIGSIICDASDAAIDDTTQSIGAGVYTYCMEELEIGSYTAICCCRGDFFAGCDTKDWVDLRIISSPGLRIGKLNSDRSGCAVVASQDAASPTCPPSGVITIGEITILDPQWAYRVIASSGPYLIYTLDSHFVIDKVRLFESVAPPFASCIASGHAFTAGVGCSIKIGEVLQNRPLNAQMFKGTPDATIARLQVGRVRVDDDVGKSIGAETLNNGATTTAVTATEITSWATLFPVISVQPVNASAMALNSMMVVPNAAPASGFSIEHAVAGAADLVSWKCLGFASLAALNLPYAWDTLVIGGAKPSARFGAAAVYVPTLDLTILFGGCDVTNTELDDTWTYNHATQVWTEIFPVTTPLARRRPAICYDSARDRIVMFGGLNTPTGVLDDTWEFYISDLNWHAVAPVASPPAVQFSSSAMSFDALRGVSCIYDTSNIWEYDAATPTWTNKGNPLPNGVSNYIMLAFDPLRGVTVLVGGYDGTPVIRHECYEWDGTTLTASGDMVRAVYDGAMVWDSNRQVMVIGASATTTGIPVNPSVTSSRTGIVWADETPTLAAGRCTPAGVYCPTRAEVMAFGGSTDHVNTGVLDETCVYRRG